MKIDLCNIFGVEEGEEFKIKHISCEGLIYKIQDNCLKRRQQDSKNFTSSGFGINKINEITNIIKLPKKKEFTDDELAIMRSLPKEYIWMTRDKATNNVCAFRYKPKKSEYETWVSEGHYCMMCIFNYLFQCIQWEDEEPVFIDDYVERGAE